MIEEKRRKKTLFFTLRGVNDFFSTSLLPDELEGSVPSELREIEKVKIGEKRIWCRQLSLQVNLPPEQQGSKSHPDFVKRLIGDIPELSETITCGESEDFIEKLKTGDENLGHVFEHVYAWALADGVFAHFSELAHILDYPIHWRTYEPNIDMGEINENFTVYHIAFFYVSEEAIPAEFFGVEERVSGYLHALMQGESFDLRERIRNFVEHRTEERGRPRKSRLPRLFQHLKGAVRAAMLIFTTS